MKIMVVVGGKLLGKAFTTVWTGCIYGEWCTWKGQLMLKVHMDCVKYVSVLLHDEECRRDMTSAAC